MIVLIQAADRREAKAEVTAIASILSKNAADFHCVSNSPEPIAPSSTSAMGYGKEAMTFIRRSLLLRGFRSFLWLTSALIFSTPASGAGLHFTTCRYAEAIPAYLQSDRDTTSVHSINTEQLRLRVLRDLTKLHSGEFHGTWKERVDSPIATRKFAYNSEIHGLFDEPADCYAMKRGVWTSSRDLSRKMVAYYGLVMTTNETIRWGEVNRFVTLRNGSDRSTDRAPVPSGEFIDPRLFGATFSDRVFGSGTLTQKEITNMFFGDPNEVTREQNGRIRLHWEGVHHQRTLWIEERGDVALPVKLSRAERYPDVVNNAWSEPLETREVVWKDVQGTFIPVAVRLQRLRPVLAAGAAIPKTPEERTYDVRSVELDIEWSRVNESIPLSEFSLEWLNVPEGTLIADDRVPQKPETTVVGDIREGRVPNYKKEPVQPDPVPPSAVSWRSPLIWINGVALLVVGTLVYLKRRRRATLTESEGPGQA